MIKHGGQRRRNRGDDSASLVREQPDPSKEVRGHGGFQSARRVIQNDDGGERDNLYSYAQTTELSSEGAAVGRRVLDHARPAPREIH